MSYRLENWSVKTIDTNPYLPPETITHVLSGEVYGHPSFTDGYRISTSKIVKSEGRVCTTRSGSEYMLGVINPDYKKYLESTGYVLDEENPVKVKHV